MLPELSTLTQGPTKDSPLARRTRRAKLPREEQSSRTDVSNVALLVQFRPSKTSLCLRQARTRPAKGCCLDLAKPPRPRTPP